MRRGIGGTMKSCWRACSGLGSSKPTHRWLCKGIITSFIFPADPKFTFDAFYRRVKPKGTSGLSWQDQPGHTFRIGNIGRLFESDIRAVLAAIAEVVQEMDLKLYVSPVIAHRPSPIGYRLSIRPGAGADARTTKRGARKNPLRGLGSPL